MIDCQFWTCWGGQPIMEETYGLAKLLTSWPEGEKRSKLQSSMIPFRVNPEEKISYSASSITGPTPSYSTKPMTLTCGS